MPRLITLSTILLSAAILLPAALPVQSAAAASKQEQIRAEYDWTRAVERRYERHVSNALGSVRKAGVAIVHLTVDREGNISKSEVVRKTGQTHLDRITNRLLKRVDELPSVPAAIEGNELGVELRIVYSSNPRVEASLVDASS